MVELTNLQRRVIGFLEAAGSKYVIAGGYPRDLFFNKTPNDMDIWVFPRIGNFTMPFLTPTMQADLRSVLSLDSTGQFRKAQLYNHENPDDPNTQSIELVMRNPGVDVIFLNRHATTIKELVDRFDCSLNRFVIGDDGTPFYVTQDGLKTKHCPGSFYQQHRTRDAREYKMKGKCVALTGTQMIELKKVTV